MEAMPLKERRRVAKTAPYFAQAVQYAKDNKAAPTPALLQSTLDAFYDNPVLLYLSLWYADTEGVSVIFTPSTRPERVASRPVRQPKKN